MVRNQALATAVALLLAMSGSALAADVPAAPGRQSGFYGGVSLRDAGRERDGISLGHLSSVWNRYTLPVTEDAGTRTLAYGGYRWTNDVAVEASLETIDRFALQPAAAKPRRGVGLALAPDADPASKAWNVDVYTSWEFRKSFALYGRMGYAQSEPQLSYAPAFVSDVVRRNRDGVNYGLGLRYDMSSALGLRLEYSRFGRLPGELPGGGLPENDQLQLGVQYRF